MAKKRFKTKLSKAQRRKDVLFLLAVIVSAYAFLLIILIGTGFFDETGGITETPLELFAMFSLMVFMVLSMPLVPVQITAIALGLQKGRAKRVYDNATYVPVHNMDYYRDNLSGLSPSLVSLLVDLDIYGKKDIVAALLRMENKKAITFQNKNCITVTADGTENLDNSELELLNLIQSGQMSSNGKIKNKKVLSRWKRNRFREAERLGYIRKKQVSYKRQIKKALALCFCLLGSIILWGVFLGSDYYNQVGSVTGTLKVCAALLVIDILIFLPHYAFIKFAAYYGREDVRWERTPLGNEMAEKIAGLSRFIHEFSLLSDTKKEQVVLWDDYLVYAIVLEENEKIVKDISKQYFTS